MVRFLSGDHLKKWPQGSRAYSGSATRPISLPHLLRCLTSAKLLRGTGQQRYRGKSTGRPGAKGLQKRPNLAERSASVETEAALVSRLYLSYRFHLHLRRQAKGRRTRMILWCRPGNIGVLCLSLEQTVRFQWHLPSLQLSQHHQLHQRLLYPGPLLLSLMLIPFRAWKSPRYLEESFLCPAKCPRCLPPAIEAVKTIQETKTSKNGNVLRSQPSSWWQRPSSGKNSAREQSTSRTPCLHAHREVRMIPENLCRDGWSRVGHSTAVMQRKTW
mmetsp:Transcript_54388/g.97199  ORF Transcript_54388/g.97199 Transcript_54388/m.97199 type:complete len:272 (+) Transcript_54388:953-1768(+)